MKVKAKVVVVPFLREPVSEPRCVLCSDKEVAAWLGACLVETRKVGASKPTASRVHREIKKAFPGRQPRSENSTRHHLREHEPSWNGWDEEG